MQNNFEKMRKKSNKSIREIAEYLDVKESTVYDWQSGRHSINQKYLIKLSDFFGCSIDDILGNATKEYLSQDAKILQAARATKLSDDEIVDLLNNLGKYTKK
jgi:transcriptional regulator with XRE-family HTH domain